MDMRLERPGNKKDNFKGGAGYEPVFFRDKFNTAAVLKANLANKGKEIKRFSVKTRTLARGEGDTGALVSVEPTTTGIVFERGEQHPLALGHTSSRLRPHTRLPPDFVKFDVFYCNVF